ncbi:hypothetical protein PG995_007454 [Apiospora arundinis]
MVKRHVLKDHQHSTATGDSKDYSSQYSGNGNMGRTWKVEVDRRLRSRQASDQVLDWETLWEVLFPEDIDIPSGDYEPIIEHHEVNKAFSDRACQGKDMVLRKMHGLQSCTSNSDLEADAGVYKRRDQQLELGQNGKPAEYSHDAYRDLPAAVWQHL